MSLLYEAEPHHCDQPRRDGQRYWPTPDNPKTWATEGSIWQCDDCCQHWLVVRNLWTYWERISDRKARRLLRRVAERANTQEAE